MAGMVLVSASGAEGQCGSRRQEKLENNDEQLQVRVVELVMTALRKSMVACRVDGEEVIVMDISRPTNVRHITHVTFDRFNGFLGLPVEFEVDVPSKVPSASVSVFGVSAESMHCSYDSKGNSIPTILLLMQERLYSNGGLKAEGIFRINPENTEENIVRDQLNRGIVPKDIDVHCLAGLIKAWFRELPCGILDGLSPEQVLECNTEEEFMELIRHLKPTESALLNWAVELMSDVVEEEELNKMNARNIAMVFAPNMTQMSDPLTALMHAVQVMNLLKTLITKTLRERDDDDEEEEASNGYSTSPSSSSWYEEELDCQHVCTRTSIGDQCNCTHFHDEAEFLSEIDNFFLQHLNEDDKITNGGHVDPNQSKDDIITSKPFSVTSSSSANSPGSATSFKASDTSTEEDSRPAMHSSQL